MNNNYYSTPRPGNQSNRCRSRIFRHGPREHWPYRRVLRRRLSDSFTSNKYQNKCHECECCTRWSNNSDYYSRHIEPYYREDNYMNSNRSGLTPAYQMLRLDSDHVAFFVEKSKLEAILSNGSGFIDKSKIPTRIDLEESVNEPFYGKKSKDQYSVVNDVDYDNQKRNPCTSHGIKDVEMNDGGESDDSDSTVYFHDVYPKGKVQVPPERPSSRNNHKGYSRTWSYYERDLSVPSKGGSYTKYAPKISISPKKPESQKSSTGYFTKEYKEYLQRNVVGNHSPESIPEDLANPKSFNEARELPAYELPQFQTPAQCNESIKRWFNNNSNDPVVPDFFMQNTKQE